MPRLYRPSIPLEVRCRVALAQLGEMWPDRVIAEWRSGRDWSTDFLVPPFYRKTHGKLLASLLERLAALLGCTVADLRLDHDPPLAARPRRGDGKLTRYTPLANNPNYLRYRPHGPQFAGSHLIKTNVRGDGAQYPDRVLIKRERRRQRAKQQKRRIGAKSQRPSVSAAKVRRPKRKWPSRPFESRRSARDGRK